MRAIAVVAFVLVMSSTAFAGPQSTIGGKRLKSETVHNTGVGWPSLFYEWWNKGQGNLDWALGAELVYGDWSGAFSDVSVGLAFNAPLRWHLHTRKHAKATTDVGIRFTPGALVGGSDRGRGRVPPPGFQTNQRVMGGLRAELAVPISIDVHDRVSVVTGATIPLTLMFAKDADPWGIIPLLVRIGVEINAAPKVAPFFLFELGPAIGIGNGT
ncbi:MAG: hypothetical protein JRJ10_14405, partial [Deltaproteobacteria bacterium]|nr:hypothetical protein [Deltaproteobacteria bacterium]